VLAVKPRRVAWTISFALMALGGMVAHALAYRAVEPSHATHEHLMAHTGHSYFVHWRTCAAFCAAIIVLALIGSVVRHARAGRSTPPPLWLFALVPPVGFVVQEHVERFLGEGAFPWLASLEPTFVVGIALQFPFALAAWLAARALLALAHELYESFRAPPRLRLPAAPITLPSSLVVAPAPIPALAHGYGLRGPPRA
jgi:hypothetical protein